MNGPEHYAEAERLLESVAKTEKASENELFTLDQHRALTDGLNRTVARAQAHATLAHVAATINVDRHAADGRPLVGQPQPRPGGLTWKTALA